MHDRLLGKDSLVIPRQHFGSLRHRSDWSLLERLLLSGAPEHQGHQHEVVPDCGSYEVRFPDGRPSKYFYFENLPGRRLRSDRAEQAVARQRFKKIRR
jgi:hypothetical protein